MRGRKPKPVANPSLVYLWIKSVAVADGRSMWRTWPTAAYTLYLADRFT